MSRFTAQALVSGLAYGVRGNLADPVHFADGVVRVVNSDAGKEIGAEDPLAYLEHAMDALRRRATSAATPQVLFWLQLALEDLGQMSTLAESLDPRLLVPDSIENAAAKLVGLAEQEGLDVSHAELRVVESFPPPHASASFAAMTYDSVDEEELGIKPGVALLASELRPLYSISLLAHEFVHAAIGRVPTSLLARGFEEGIADMYGGVFLAGELLGRELAERIVLSSRLRYGREQPWRLYRDALVTVAGLTLIAGESEVKELVKSSNRQGRQIIREAEERLLAGSYEAVPGAASRFSQEVLAHSPDSVISPLAFLIGREAREDESLESLAARFSVPLSSVEDVASELQERVFMAVAHQDALRFNAVPFYSQVGGVRYDTSAELLEALASEEEVRAVGNGGGG